MIEEGLEVGGEYYVSLAYKNLVKKPNSVTAYPLQHFMQWGTPEDVDEYNYWSKAFVSLLSKDEDENTQKGSTVIPMAGLGKRFADQGYIETKPLINVSGLPMVIQSTRDLPKSNNYVFVIRSDMQGYEEVKKELNENFPNLIIKTINFTKLLNRTK